MTKNCNICGSEVDEFLRVPTAKGGLSAPCECPVCKSMHRHRYQKYIIDKYTKIKDDAKILHFAPEKWFEDWVKINNVENYTTADIQEGHGMRCIDITNMKDVPDDSYDFCIANHVMEHIVDDRKAVSEIIRVLKPEGKAILSFPVYFDLDVTYEDPSITDPKERLTAFDQEDHVRKYGKDFEIRYRKYGLNVAVYISHEELDDAERERMGIIPRDMIMVGDLKCIGK